jgi:hypothetical protein
MKITQQVAGLSIVAFALIGGAASAQTASSNQTNAAAPAANEHPAGKTPAQVRAELIAAQKAGEIPVGFTALTKRELDPAHYGAAITEPQLARARSANGTPQATQ